MRCSGVPFLKCTIWPFPLSHQCPSSNIYKRAGSQNTDKKPALCPSHFKTTLCIAPLFSVNIFMRGPVSQYKGDDLFKNVCLHILCVCAQAHSQNHFLLAFTYYSFIFECSLVLFTQNGKASILCCISVLLSHL